jgi:hypothetical protein
MLVQVLSINTFGARFDIFDLMPMTAKKISCLCPRREQYQVLKPRVGACFTTGISGRQMKYGDVQKLSATAPPRGPGRIL